MSEIGERDLEQAGIELLLREPEIVAWLDDRRREPEEQEETAGNEPPRAA